MLNFFKKKDKKQEHVLVHWTDTLKVNVQTIDAQHKRLVEMINQLYTALQEDETRKQLAEIIANLRAYAAFHFAEEEYHLEKLNYPKDKLDYHKKEHAYFEEKVQEFEEKFLKGEPLGEDVLFFLAEWLVNHIKKTDKNYGPFLNKHGVR